MCLTEMRLLNSGQDAGLSFLIRKGELCPSASWDGWHESVKGTGCAGALRSDHYGHCMCVVPDLTWFCAQQCGNSSFPTHTGQAEGPERLSHSSVDLRREHGHTAPTPAGLTQALSFEKGEGKPHAQDHTVWDGAVQDPLFTSPFTR